MSTTNKPGEFNIKASVDENIQMGLVEMLVLQILDSEGDDYAYSLREKISRLSNGSLNYDGSKLYIPMLRMESRGLVSSRRELVVGKRFRTYYHIEAPGKEYLAYAKRQWLAVYGSVSAYFASVDKKTNDKKESE